MLIKRFDCSESSTPINGKIVTAGGMLDGYHHINTPNKNNKGFKR
jgi:hypothetical protein